MNKIILKEKLLISDKAIFILREMKRNGGWLNLSSDYDYLTREKILEYWTKNQRRDDFASMDKAKSELHKHNLIYHSNPDCDGCYIKYSITEKGYEVLKLTKRVKTFKYNVLRKKK